MNLSTYLKEILKELSLSTFPSQNVVITFTIFVIGFTAVMAAYLGALDLGFGEVIIQGINNYKVPVIEVASTTIDIATTTATTSATTSIPTNILVQ